MFYIGVDLGQRVDFTAIAVVERGERVRAWREPLYLGLAVRWLERMPLGTPYTAVARRVVEVAAQLGWNCAVAVDATGLGAPVVDLLREAPMHCEVAPVVITGGEKANEEGRLWHVPKRDLVSGLQLLIERGTLRIARKLNEAGRLVKELVDMRTMRTRTGRERFGAEGAGEHDDLVMATALACWMAERPGIGFGGGRLPGI
jgi:hypothetical protein